MTLFADISNFVNNELGLDTSLSTVSSDNSGSFPPWYSSEKSINPAFEDVFFGPILIKPERWNKLYPYRLLVVDISKGGEPRVVGREGVSAGSLRTRNVQPDPARGIEYVLSQEVVSGSWEFALPITPKQLSIQDQFSINTSATMRGIVEEHNGVKFKIITASGTTGIWPRKPTVGGALKTPTSIGSIFGGTLENISSLSENVSKIVKVANGKNPNSALKTQDPSETSATLFSTGYYQALLMGQFLERYAQEKRKPQNKGWRLVFDIPKQNKSFIVTPVSFSLNQSEQKPNEIMFNMQLKAWKRINLRDQVQPLSSELPKFEANLFQQIVGTISQTRRTLSSATNLIKAVRSDFQKPLNVLRQTSLAVKDLGGLAFTVADLPGQLVEDFKSSIKGSLNIAKNSFKRPVSRGGASGGGSTGTFVASAISIKSQSPSARSGAAVNAIVAQDRQNEGLSQEAVAAGALGVDAARSLETNPLNVIFENPEEYFDLFDEVGIDDLNLTPEQQQAFEDELERISLITIDDLRDFKETLLELALQISNNFGAGDQTYADIYGLQDPKTRVIDMTVEENEILADIYESIQALDLLTSTKRFDDFKVESPLEFVGGLANESGIDFDIPTSKFLVPVPFGSTIEEIAARYLGDADKWIEIATLNALRSPYIDEDGFIFKFLSNAEGRQFNVDNSEDKLFLGQRIILQSDTVPQFSRKIIDIEKLGDGNYLITVDGDSDLGVLKFVDNARMQGYLPGTVNSQNQIYIPSNLPSEEDDRTFAISHLDEPNLTKVSKVDFLLTDKYDVALNSIGDFRLANGLTNLVQALKLKIITKKGTLLRHLDYGLGINHGVSVADIESGELLISLNKMVQSDTRFESITSLNIKLIGSTLSIDLAIKIANNSGIVPVSFDVNI